MPLTCTLGVTQGLASFHIQQIEFNSAMSNKSSPANERVAAMLASKGDGLAPIPVAEPG